MSFDRLRLVRALNVNALAFVQACVEERQEMKNQARYCAIAIMLQDQSDDPPKLQSILRQKAGNGLLIQTPHRPYADLRDLQFDQIQLALSADCASRQIFDQKQMQHNQHRG